MHQSTNVEKNCNYHRLGVVVGGGGDGQSIATIIHSYQKLVLVSTVLLTLFVVAIVVYTYRLNLDLQALKDEVHKLQQEVEGYGGHEGHEGQKESQVIWSVDVLSLELGEKNQSKASDSESWDGSDSGLSRTGGVDLHQTSPVEGDSEENEEGERFEMLDSAMPGVDSRTSGRRKRIRRSATGNAGENRDKPSTTKQKKQVSTEQRRRSNVRHTGTNRIEGGGGEGGETLVVHYEARPGSDKYHVSSHVTPGKIKYTLGFLRFDK